MFDTTHIILSVCLTCCVLYIFWMQKENIKHFLDKNNKSNKSNNSNKNKTNNKYQNNRKYNDDNESSFSSTNAIDDLSFIKSDNDTAKDTFSIIGEN